MVACEIEFENNPNKIYFAGQMLRGTVQLTLTEAKTVRSIYIQIHGKGYCRWIQGRASYTGKQEYLNETTYFIGGSDADNIQVDAGSYKYDFQCNLPDDLPTSIEGKYGHTRYSVRVVIDIPMWLNKEFKEKFTVIKLLDLNKDSSLQSPVTAEQNSSSCFSAPLEFTAHLPMVGFVPGQMICMEIHVDNKDRKNNYEFTVKLVKKIEYFSTAFRYKLLCPIRGWCGKNINREHRDMAQKRIPVRPENSDKIIHVNVQVPSIPPTDTQSEVIQVSYYLKIIASVGLCRYPTIEIPITIGSYQIQVTPQNVDASCVTEPTDLNSNDQSPACEKAEELDDQHINDQKTND